MEIDSARNVLQSADRPEFTDAVRRVTEADAGYEIAANQLPRIAEALQFAPGTGYGGEIDQMTRVPRRVIDIDRCTERRLKDS